MIDATTGLTLLSNTLIAAGVGLVAWWISIGLRRPAIAHSLFLLALIALLTPPVWRLSVLPASTSTEPSQSRDWSSNTRSDIDVGRGTTSQPTAKEIVTTRRRGPAEMADSIHRAGQPPVRAEPRADPFDWGIGLVALWTIGSLVIAGATMRRTRRFIRAAHDAPRAPSSLVHELERLAIELGAPTPPRLDVRVSTACCSPALLRTLRCSILVLPRMLLDQPVSTRESILIHELAHVQRGDGFVRWFECLVVTLLWWHPLSWWLRAGLRDAEERTCDAWVVALRPAVRRGYCDALLDLDEHELPDWLPNAASGALGTRNWQRRLGDIMTHNIPHRSGRTTRMVTVAFALALVPLGFAQDTNPSQAEPPLDAVVEKPRFEQADLATWTKWLALRGRINIVIDDRVAKLPPDQTTLRGVALPRLPLRKVIDLLTQILDLRWSEEAPHLIRIWPRTDSSATQTATVQVLGAIESPGPVKLPSDRVTLLELMARRTLTDDADISRVHWHRPDPQHPLSLTINLRRIVQSADTPHNVPLLPGDIIFVPRRSELPPLRLGIGDRLEFVLGRDLLGAESLEMLDILRKPQRVQRDGTILLPFHGDLNVLGCQRAEAEQRVRAALQERFAIPIELKARFLPGH